ncbi:MAG: histidine phosphatase family protein, partial [Micromonosporaceae bacterium]
TPVRIRQDSRLRECDYGELNGAPVTELLPRVKHIDRPFPGGQSYRDVVELTRDFLRELSRNHVGHRILLVAHSANRWALQHLLEGARLEDLVDAPFQWQEGWHYQLPARWTG